MPGSGAFKIDKGLKGLRSAIKTQFRKTRYRTFTFVAKDKLSIADGGSGRLELGGLDVDLEAERKDASVTLKVKISQADGVASEKSWNVSPGQECIQYGPKSGNGRLFVSTSVDKQDKKDE